MELNVFLTTVNVLVWATLLCTLVAIINRKWTAPLRIVSWIMGVLGLGLLGYSLLSGNGKWEMDGMTYLMVGVMFFSIGSLQQLNRSKKFP